MSQPESKKLKNFQLAALKTARSLSLKYHLSVDEHDQEWQRVNSYVADILKDTHVLYAKLARLQGDFIGAELSELESISEQVLDLGEVLSKFMKAFHSGDASMLKTKSFGNPGQAPVPPVPSESVPPAPDAPPVERTDDDYESEIRSEEDGEFEEFDEEFDEEEPTEEEPKE